MSCGGANATFTYATWIQTFPEFANVPEGTVVDQYAPLAAVYCPIDGSSPVRSSVLLQALYNLMVAHVTLLLAGSTLQDPSPLVGRIASASEGSVSVSVDMPATSPSAAWYMQSKYGAMYWQMLAPYRLMTYIPGRPRQMNPYPWPFNGQF